jgi:hypothetical protein
MRAFADENRRNRLRHQNRPTDYGVGEAGGVACNGLFSSLLVELSWLVTSRTRLCSDLVFTLLKLKTGGFARIEPFVQSRGLALSRAIK